MEFTIQKLRENMWALDQRGVRAFLLAGPDKAILIDTCFGGDIRSVCETITDQPITLITTHSDGDHIGCDHQFSVHYIHTDECVRYQAHSKEAVELIPVQEGDSFEVGEYKLEVILIPGHTPGSIGLLDRQHGFILTGDTVQANWIFMHGDGRDLKAFRESILKLERMHQEGAFDTIYASHGAVSLPADILQDHWMLADEILGGTAVPVGPAPDWFPDTVKTYAWGRTQMYY